MRPSGREVIIDTPSFAFFPRAYRHQLPPSAGRHKPPQSAHPGLKSTRLRCRCDRRLRIEFREDEDAERGTPPQRHARLQGSARCSQGGEPG